MAAGKEASLGHFNSHVSAVPGLITTHGRSAFSAIP